MQTNITRNVYNVTFCDRKVLVAHTQQNNHCFDKKLNYQYDTESRDVDLKLKISYDRYQGSTLNPRSSRCQIHVEDKPMALSVWCLSIFSLSLAYSPIELIGRAHASRVLY